MTINSGKYKKKIMYLEAMKSIKNRQEDKIKLFFMGPR